MPRKGITLTDKNDVKRYTAIVFLVNLLLASVLLFNLYNSLKEKEINEAHTYGNHAATTIRLSIMHSLNATEMLRSHYIEHGEDFLRNFDHIAERLMGLDSAIQGLYYAPDGVVRYAYPESIRKAIFGFDMFKHEEQKEMALKAYFTHQPTLAGPHMMIEGGSGIIIRNPVYRMTGEFEGFAICAMNWERMAARIRDDIGESDKYVIGVWKEDGKNTVTDQNGYIFTTGEMSDEKSLNISVVVPNDVWHLTVQPKKGGGVWLEFLPYLLYYLISLLALTGTVYLALSHIQRMREVEQQATEAKDNFFANLSHDIRTPLNGIMGMVAIARKNHEDKNKVEECLQKISDVSNHLLLLVNDILDIRRIEAGKLELDIGNVDLQAVCRSCADVVQGQADKGGVQLKTDFARLPQVYVRADERSLRQIMVNIIGNAVKFTPSGGSVFFTVEQLEATEKTAKVRFSIRDTGIGMSEEFLTKIWNAFSQENSGRINKLQQGTGLGMNIAKNLVDLMEGTIAVTSKVGEGTCFTVELPFERCAAADTSSEMDVASIDLTGLRILLAEDNELNMEIALEILQDQGCIVTPAVNGQEVVDFFSRQPAGSFDVIVTDIMMPVMDGIEATKAVRALPREDAKTIPIIAMTANAFKEDRDSTKDVGFDAYLTKPIDVELALTTLAKLAGKTERNGLAIS